jgi:hypothetical protein
MEEAALPMIRSGYFRTETKCRRTKDESHSAFRPADIPNGFLDHYGSGGGFYFGGDSVGAVAGKAEEAEEAEEEEEADPSPVRASRAPVQDDNEKQKRWRGDGWSVKSEGSEGSKGSEGSRGSSRFLVAALAWDDNEKLKLKAKRQRKTRGIGYE